MSQRRYTYFISDLHLGAKYLKNPRDYEQRVVDWLGMIKDDAKEMYMLGDVLDYWYEYKTVVREATSASSGRLRRLPMPE